jgi:hypothetical protein
VKERQLFQVIITAPDPAIYDAVKVLVCRPRWACRGEAKPSMGLIVLLVLLVSLGLGYGAYRIIGNGFRFPQSEKLNFFGVFGYFVLIVLGVWLVTTLFNSFF